MSEMDGIVVDTASRIFANASETGAGFDAAAWSAVQEAGLDRLLLSEEAGGAGDAYEAAAALARSLGAHAPAIPLVETLVADWCLGHAGLDVPPGPKALFLAPAGAAAVLAWPLALAVAVIVQPGPDKGADVRLLDEIPAGRDGVNLAGEPMRCIDAGGIGKAASSGLSGRSLDDALALFATLKAAAIVGALETAFTVTVDYANTRKQFGRRIGAFQAVQHMIARMAEEVAASSAAVGKASRSLGTPGGLFAAAVAKARASGAVAPVVAIAHQCHGAIGFTREHALHRFTTRALAWRDEAGSEAYWHERLGAAALRAGAGGLWVGLTAGSLM